MKRMDSLLYHVQLARLDSSVGGSGSFNPPPFGDCVMEWDGDIPMQWSNGEYMEWNCNGEAPPSSLTIDTMSMLDLDDFSMSELELLEVV